MVLTIVASVDLRPLAVSPTGASRPAVGTPIDTARALFYNASYEAAAESALKLVETDPSDLPAIELRTSALLFQIKRAVGSDADKERAFKQCAICPQVIDAFRVETARGQTAARARLAKEPLDDAAQFYLGKIDLNHVWLHLGTLGRRTGWSEYWEARRSLDAVLQRNPRHARARLARAWIDYIVDTRVRWGTRWLLGGGNKKRALTLMREAATTDSGDYFADVEARFALWDVHVRERNVAEALAIARLLAEEFPDNPELSKFIAAGAASSPGR